ncbi:hypothetical protein ECPA7_0206 [Escherichia coli PA7]|nr:hypothetical protein ECPA7_0206 [Escherichia coli PA7]
MSFICIRFVFFCTGLCPEYLLQGMVFSGFLFIMPAIRGFYGPPCPFGYINKNDDFYCLLADK